jgi:hypothetical protein
MEEYIIILITFMILCYYYFKNKNKCIERYFIENDFNLYTTLKISYFILITSLLMNVKFIFAKQI